MNKRILAVLLALALIAVGVVFLLGYARNADERAQSGAELVDVLQVTATIEAGTTAEDLGTNVKLTKVPRSALVRGALSSLDKIEGLATTTALYPGDQLVETRFSEGGLVVGKTETSLPRGFQEVTVLLAAERAAGGVLKPGDTVGVVASFATGSGDAITRMIQHQVLVTRVQAIGGAAEGGASASAATYLVTLAVKTGLAGDIINTVEFGKLYLTYQDQFTEKGQGGVASKVELGSR